MSTTGQTECGCNHQPEDKSTAATFSILKNWKPWVSFIMLAVGLILDYLISAPWFTGSVRLGWYFIAYLPVGIPVLRMAFINLKKGEVFTEFFLMGIATIGAFYIGEYPEGVAVMLFYSVGELFQHGAVEQARNNIKALLDVRSETAHVIRNGEVVTVHPKSVEIGEIVQVNPGERIPLDGELITERSTFDTSALTGESKPREFKKGDTLLSGMVNSQQVVKLKVTSSYENSSISRILTMVQEASSRKAKTETFIRSFAKVYTPAVVFLASLLVILPAFFVSPYVFEDWLYRGLVFLVISCPCALVISIPLGYFGGIGAASQNGILVKGSNYLDALRSVTTVVFDKTGTLTEGAFTVRDIDIPNGHADEVLSLLFAVEKSSTHPIAGAITKHLEDRVGSTPAVQHQEEIPGLGIRAKIDGKTLLVGSQKLMETEQVLINSAKKNGDGATIYIALKGKHVGTVTIADQVKEDAITAIEQLQKLGVRQTIMLSGDRQQIAEDIGKALKIDQIFGDLLPDEKAAKLETIKGDYPGVTAYAGDGINDAPVLALSDVGIAMGAMGSDVAIETADVVIQTDQPSKIATAIRIARSTRNIVWQNIGMAMGIKLLFLSLGALGMATLWEAVFADVGVALLAILNAVRIQKMDFNE